MIITKKQNELEYLVAEGITASHCFTTRHGGVSTGSKSSLSLAYTQGDTMENVETNLGILGKAMGFDTDKLVMTLQIHSDIVRAVTDRDHLGLCHNKYPKCDGLVTNTPGVALLIFTADCTPLLFHDPVTGAVGAAHAGWRGTAANIAGKTVEAMTAAYGCKPENIRAAIGPHIGQCCFETDKDVPDVMIEALGKEALSYIVKKGDKYYLDLTQINSAFLRRAGIQHIETCPDCTACQPDRFWSYRRVGAKRGSQGAIIVCKKEGTR